MGSTDWLYYVMDVIGVILLGLAIAYGMIWTGRRRRDTRAGVRGEEATHRVYEEAERERQEKERS